MQNTLWDLIPVKLVTNILNHVEYNKYKNLRLVCKEMKQIVDSEASDIIPRLITRRRDHVWEYVERWIDISAPMLKRAALGEGYKNDHLYWEKEMNEFDTEAIIFMSKIAVLFQDTVLHDMTHFCFYIPCRDRLIDFINWVARMMALHDPHERLFDLLAKVCKYDVDGTALNSIRSCMMMDEDRIIGELGELTYGNFAKGLQLHVIDREIVGTEYWYR